MPKIIQSGGFCSALLDKIADLLMKVAVKHVLAPLATIASVFSMDSAIQRKNSWKRCCKSKKRNHYNHEDMDDKLES